MSKINKLISTLASRGYETALISKTLLNEDLPKELKFYFIQTDIRVMQEASSNINDCKMLNDLFWKIYYHLLCQSIK